MANPDTDSNAYDKAQEITEKALDAYVKNDTETGDKLIEEAKSLDETAVKDVHDMLEEDAASEHDPAKLNEGLSKSVPG